jgi:hypothetical protein
MFEEEGSKSESPLDPEYCQYGESGGAPVSALS